MKRFFLILLVCVCCRAPLTRGTVTYKEFIPDHWETMYIWMTTSYNSNGTPATSMLVPITTHYPDRYWMRIDGHDKNGNDQFTRYNISKGEYDDLQIGQYWRKREEIKD